ncbi:energy-coupling factor transporter transmembrane protein EcfT [Candidatus Microgenomates bacterium]|nr:energy-coupling factor transporter transmembrane protein EcfT [Candidatus Microgenomates bacterium]
MTETFISRQSVIHGLNFWTKFLCLLLLLPLTTFISLAKFLPIIALVFFGILFLSRIVLKKFWLLTRGYVIGITVGVTLLSFFFSPGTLEEKLLLGFVLALRFVLLITFGLLFSVVTNPIEIPTGLLQAKIPHKYGITLMVGYRMMPLLSQKIEAVINAQKARGANISFSPANWPRLPLVAASLVIPILHSTLETSVRLSDALISRGYDPEGKITVAPTKFSFPDILVFTVSLATLFVSFAKI